MNTVAIARGRGRPVVYRGRGGQLPVSPSLVRQVSTLTNQSLDDCAETVKTKQSVSRCLELAHTDQRTSFCKRTALGVARLQLCGQGNCSRFSALLVGRRTAGLPMDRVVSWPAPLCKWSLVRGANKERPGASKSAEEGKLFGITTTHGEI